MKICLLNIAYYPNVEGGAEISTQKLAEGLTKNNEVAVICNGKHEDDCMLNDVKIYHVEARFESENIIKSYINKRYNFHVKSELKKALMQIKPDVLHTNNLHEFTVMVWDVATELHIPIVHTIRDYTLNNPRHFISKTIVKNGTKKVNCVTAPSKYTLDYFDKKKLFSNKCIKAVVYNAIDLNSQEILTNKIRKISRNDEVLNFAYLGRYSEEKGINWLLEVFVKHSNPNQRLHLFGKGDMSNREKALIDGIKVIEHGFVDEDSLRECLKTIDVVIVPSLWNEPFGRVVLDAYRAFCPVIVTNMGGLPEIVDNQSTGIIIKRDDNDLINAIKYFDDRDKIRNMMGSIEIKLKEFDVLTQVCEFEKLYKNIVGEKT